MLPPPYFYNWRNLLSLYFMTDRSAGLVLGELAFRENLTLPEARRLVAFCRANQFWDVLKKILPPIQQTYPADTVFVQAAVDATATHQ